MMVVVLYLQSCGGDCRVVVTIVWWQLLSCGCDCCAVVMSCDGSCVILTVVGW